MDKPTFIEWWEPLEDGFRLVPEEELPKTFEQGSERDIWIGNNTNYIPRESVVVRLKETVCKK